MNNHPQILSDKSRDQTCKKPDRTHSQITFSVLFNYSKNTRSRPESRDVVLSTFLQWPWRAVHFCCITLEFSQRDQVPSITLIRNYSWGTWCDPWWFHQPHLSLVTTVTYS